MADEQACAMTMQGWLDRLQAGETEARAELIRYCGARLRRLTRRMLDGYPGVRRWEQTDDVLQNALLRLYRCLAEVHPSSPRDFFGLAATQVRRELLDLARHHFGAEGHGANHATDAMPDGRQGHRPDPADATGGPSDLAEWGEFHLRVESLPNADREVFGLLWYGGLTQVEAARVLGVDERTIKRRWRSARVALYEALGGEPPGA